MSRIIHHASDGVHAARNQVEDLDAFLAGLTVAMPNLTYGTHPCRDILRQAAIILQ